jgi:site-specific DNA-cytosine methylase
VNERTCIDLFTGLGCFSIAARANGVRTVAMCEIKSDCRHFLSANWPGVTIHDNAKTLDARQYKGVWLVCGGPPCQPASVAGEQLGEADHRWLWPEAVRIVGECEPAWFLFENPPGIRSVGLDGVLAGLEAQGYEVGTLNIPACAVNSPQRRARLWIVGHTKDHTGRLPIGHGRGENPELGGAVEDRPVGHATKQPERVQNLQALPDAWGDARRAFVPTVECGNVAFANSQPRISGKQYPERGPEGRDADGRTAALDLWGDFAWIECGDGKRRRAKPGVCGVVDGPSVGLLEALGNAIVWPIAASVVRAMIQAEEL